MNAKQRRVWRRGIARHMDAWTDAVYGGHPAHVRLCPRLRESPGFWTALEKCEDAARGEDPYDDEGDEDWCDEDYWDEEDEQDDDGDPLGCWEGGDFTPGLWDREQPGAASTPTSRPSATHQPGTGRAASRSGQRFSADSADAGRRSGA